MIKKDEQILNELKQYEPRGMHEHQLPVVWESSHNGTVRDINEKLYIDFTSGIFVTNVGHGTVATDVIQQAAHLIHCYTFAHHGRLELAKKLREMTGYEKSFFLSAGTEATECAVKLMRMASKKKVIVSFAGSMHGKTQLAEQLRGDFTWAIQDGTIVHLPFPGPESSFSEDVFSYLNSYDNKIAGFMIESYRGWDAGFYSKEYIQRLCSWAKKKDILVCFDEIQGGFGRTGKLFAFEHYDVKPDLVCVGKGLGGGLPISAVLGPAKILDIPDDLSSTQSGNPLCCAAALASLDYLDKNQLVKLTDVKGEFILKELDKIKKYKCVKEVNSKGLLIAVIFYTAKQADRVIYRAMHKGLLMVRTGRESIKIGPPLTMPIEGIMEGFKILQESINEERTTKKAFHKI